jgi:hypothetical protein
VETKRSKSKMLEQARVEVETRRAKTEDDREARLQRKQEWKARIEKLRIEAQRKINHVDEIGRDDAAQGKLSYVVM